MHRLTISAASVWFLVTAGMLAAQDKKAEPAPESKPVEGTLTDGARTYKLAHAVAYETKSDDEATVTVLASDRKIPFDKIQAALRENDGSDERLSLSQPYVIVAFDKSGKAVRCRGNFENGAFSTSGETLKGELKLENGRARGQAQLETKKDSRFKSAFNFRWDVVLGAEPAKPARPAGPVKPSVTGTFKGNGKPAKLAFVSARPGEPFSDKASIVLVFTEKDHSKDKKPDFKAGFGEYGSALIISVFEEDGGIFSCQVAHAAHGRMPFSSSGSIRTAGFDVEEGKVEGELTTDGEQKFFDKTWEVDLKFTAPYAAPAKKVAKADPPATKKAPDKPAKEQPKKKPDPDADEDDDDEDAPPAKGAEALNVKDLALPKDAADVVYKKLVGQMTFKSATGVKALAAEFSKKLADQGWKSDDTDLLNPNSTILNRKRGKASLTIFVKPADKGSTVLIMTEGLDWKEKDK